MDERREIEELVAGYENLSKRAEELQAQTEGVRAIAERLDKDAVAKIEELDAENAQLRKRLQACQSDDDSPLTDDTITQNERFLLAENEELRAKNLDYLEAWEQVVDDNKQLRFERDDLDAMWQNVVRNLYVRDERLRATIEQAVEELDAEHWPEWSNNEAERAGKEPVGCGMCWPKDGSWPCSSRMVADDLRKVL